MVKHLGGKLMRKDKEKQEKVKTNKHVDKGQIFVKGMALFLAILMLVATCSTLIFAIIFG